MSKFQSYLNYIADPRARRSLRSIFTTFLNDDEDMTFRSFTFGASGASVSVAVLDFEDAFHGKIIETGTYSSAVDKGVALSDTNARPVSFLFDDSANSLTADVRAVLSRVYLSVDQDGGGTIFPIRSQLKLAAGVDFGVGGRYGCIDAYMELAGDTQIKSGVEASLLDVRLEIASTKTLTVAASGELIGIHVQLIGAGTLTTTGDSYGIKVEDNGTITGDWKYGVYLANVTTGLYVGACTTGITLGGAFTTGLSIAADGTTAISVTDAFSGVNMISLAGTGSTSGIIISGACAIPLNITGAFTTGVTIAADGTTAISVTSAFTGVDMISLAGTGSTSGITISGACVIPLNITGAFTTGITIAADGTTAISVTSAFSGVTGISLAGTGSTAGINISGNHTTAITIGAQTTAGVAITGATATGISITGACSTAALQMGVSGTPAGDLVWYGTTALYLVRFDANGDTNGAVYIGTDTKGLMFNLYGDITGCGVFWDPSGDTNGSLTIGGSGGSKGVDVTMYGATNGCSLKWDQSANTLALAGGSIITITGTGAAATTKAISTSGFTLNNGNLGDGYGAVEVDLTLAGTAAGHCSALSSWINTTAGTTGAGLYMAAITAGIYQDASEIADTILITGMRIQGIVSDTDYALLVPFSLNHTQNINALFSIGSPDSKAGVVIAGGGNSTAVGSLAMLIDSNGTVYYVKLYSDAAA